MEEQQLQELIERYISDRCSPEEIRLLAAELADGNETLLAEMMDQQLEASKATANDFPGLDDKISEAVMNRIYVMQKETALSEPLHQGRVIHWKRWAVAAAVLIIAGAGFFALRMNRDQKDMPVVKLQPATPAIISPGKDGAVLTLADGSTMILDSLGNGVVTTQSGIKVILNNGQLVYDANGAAGGEIAINTISTPKGRQFRLQLEDGTKVWLNAASSLKYPAVFTGKERVVEITGEAYFEVAKDKNRPFHVKLNNETEIEVLGTQFNVNSYTNESSINTTLLEGSVQINSRGAETVIRPGQQAQVFPGTGRAVNVVNAVNTDRVTAWKNGVFNFENASLYEVMRQLERWYDIEVEYDKGVQNYEFLGKMDRDLSLQDVLRGLEMSEVHFKIVNDRKIVVTQ